MRSGGGLGRKNLIWQLEQSLLDGRLFDHNRVYYYIEVLLQKNNLMLTFFQDAPSTECTLCPLMPRRDTNSVVATSLSSWKVLSMLYYTCTCIVGTSHKANDDFQVLFRPRNGPSLTVTSAIRAKTGKVSMSSGPPSLAASCAMIVVQLHQFCNHTVLVRTAHTPNIWWQHVV